MAYYSFERKAALLKMLLPPLNLSMAQVSRRETEQNKSFDELIARVKGAEKSVTLLSFQSLQAERRGDIPSAIAFSELMIELAPETPRTWYRGCYLLDRYSNLSARVSMVY